MMTTQADGRGTRRQRLCRRPRQQWIEEERPLIERQHFCNAEVAATGSVAIRVPCDHSENDASADSEVLVCVAPKDAVV
ncbi:MAG TPA: hypothetical protein VFH93_11855 [Thermoleophilia bacterium]|nr:hypothetical protein [Thermoleophilia bacterium]